MGLLERWDEHNQRVADRQLKAPPPPTKPKPYQAVLLSSQFMFLVLAAALPICAKTKNWVLLAFILVAMAASVTLSVIEWTRTRRRSASPT